MEQCQWKIVYGSAVQPVELRTVELLSAEMGNRIQRDFGMYSLYTIVCEQAGEAYPDRNAVIVGTLENNPLLRRHFSKDDIPANGFRVRIMANPRNRGAQLVLIAGADSAAVLYGVIVFLDDIIPSVLLKDNDGICSADKAFIDPFPKLDIADAPETLVRSVFTWGHPIGDFHAYLKNLARMKFNRVIIWNEYPPLNAAEVVEYAHSWNIQVFWGFAWGWSTSCGAADLRNLDVLRESILQNWRGVWSQLPGDGYYFQSFTEIGQDSIDGISIAESVVSLVNETAAAIFEEKPDIQLIFGLHALSVKTHIPEISRTDARLEILWEDCGGFPYRYTAAFDPEGDQEFTRRLLGMPQRVGLVFKCQLMQKWKDFVHQAGPYVLGCNGERIQNHDVQLTTPMWHEYQALWLKNGKIAYELARLIHEEGTAETELNIASQLNGPIRFPTALTAELFWSTRQPYEAILQRVLNRPWLHV